MADHAPLQLIMWGCLPLGGCRKHGLVNRRWVASLSALPPLSRPPRPGHTGVDSSPARVPVQGGARKEGHHRVTGFSLQACKTSSLTLCWPRDWNPGLLGNLLRLIKPERGGALSQSPSSLTLPKACPLHSVYQVSATAALPLSFCSVPWWAQRPSSSARLQGPAPAPWGQGPQLWLSSPAEAPPGDLSPFLLND